jgi:hypothetical protein
MPVGPHVVAIVLAITPDVDEAVSRFIPLFRNPFVSVRISINRFMGYSAKRQNQHAPVGNSVLVKMDPLLLDALTNLAARESITNAELVRSLVRKAAKKLEWYKKLHAIKETVAA